MVITVLYFQSPLAFVNHYLKVGASQVSQWVNNLPAMQEMQVQSLGREDALEDVMTTHSSILAWRIPWTEEPGGPWSRKESDTNEASEHAHMHH